MRRFFIPLLPAMLLAVPTAAQGVLVPADSAEVASHVVTEKEYERFVSIVMRMDSAYAVDPSAFSGITEKVDGPLSLDYIAVRYASNAAMHGELARAGMTSREFIVAGLALMNALRAAEMEDASRLDALPLPQLANARLVRCRMDEVGRLFATLRAVIPG